MTDEELDKAVDAAPPEVPVRKPWTAPTLTVQRIDEMTHGTRTSTRADGGAGDNYIS